MPVVEKEKILLVYGSRSGHTQELAAAVADGVRAVVPAGLEVRRVGETTVAELSSCGALLLGSPTYFRDMMASMKQFFFMAEQAKLAGKPAAAFATYGWSGECLPMMVATMEHILGLRMFGGTLAVKGKPSVNDLERGRAFGRAFAEFVLSCQNSGKDV
ncbi:MAG: FprA family A-type flavoprotein [Deltaproteobacteria bacterium]|nr:FprA family A-type flavoprotein [Candidatus Anaeroferrophillus wilburensis]MBN2887914.1 FprA family A-type flavoprotein [Deltaproteobacteria bacterium]